MLGKVLSSRNGLVSGGERFALVRASAHKLPLRSDSVQCIVTSPPYWSLRRYAGNQDIIWGGAEGCRHHFVRTFAKASHYTGKRRWQHIVNGRQEFRSEAAADLGRTKVRDLDPSAWGHPLVNRGSVCSRCAAWRGPLGLEPTPEMYVEHSIQVMRELRRVLRPDGILWWNIADTYFGSWGDYVAGKHEGEKPMSDSRWRRPAYQQVGYHERPPSAAKHSTLKKKDMCLIPFRVALAAQADGWWVRSVIVWDKPNSMPESVRDRPTRGHEYLLMLAKSEKYFFNMDAVREPHKPDHHNPAARGGIRQLRGGAKSALMNKWYGAGSNYSFRAWGKGGRNLRSVWRFPTRPFRGAHFATFPEDIPRRCILASTRPNDAVLDPFAGSGTTGKAALELGRRAVLADLAYHGIARKRITPA